MRSLLKPWKIVTIALILVIFSSLYGFIYYESIKPPSDNWSNPQMIDTYDSASDYNSVMANNTLALPINENQFANIVVEDTELIISIYDDMGTFISENKVILDFIPSDLTGRIEDGFFKLIVSSDVSGHIEFLTFGIDDYDNIDRSNTVMKDYSIELSPTHAVAYNQSEVITIQENNSSSFVFESKSKLTSANSLIVSDQVINAIIFIDKGTYKLMRVTTKDGGLIVGEILHTLSSQGTLKPVNIEMVEYQEKIEILVTMKDVRNGESYLEHFYLNEDHTLAHHEKHEMNTYEATPYIVKNTGAPLMYLFNQNDKSLGRTEVARGQTAYPNLFSATSLTEQDFKQLTKSQVTCRKPSMIKMGDYNYLIHNEQHGEQNMVYLSTDNPIVIAQSKKMSVELAIDVFYRTIVNYPALMFTGIIPTITILLPVMLIAVPFLMVKIGWVESNIKKTTALILAIYTVSKIYVFSSDIFRSYALSQTMPYYLKSSTNHWAVLLLISMMTMFIAWNRAKDKKALNEYFLKSVGIYILLDCFALNLFFLPYTII